MIISKLKTSVEKTDEEDDTLGGKFTVRIVFPSSTAAAAAPDPQSVVGLCARSREPEWVEGGGGKVLGGQGGAGARHPPGSQALHLLSPLHPFHLFFPAFQHSNPLKAHLSPLL